MLTESGSQQPSVLPSALRRKSGMVEADGQSLVLLSLWRFAFFWLTLKLHPRPLAQGASLTLCLTPTASRSAPKKSLSENESTAWRPRVTFVCRRCAEAKGLCEESRQIKHTLFFTFEMTHIKKEHLSTVLFLRKKCSKSSLAVPLPSSFDGFSKCFQGSFNYGDAVFR